MSKQKKQRQEPEDESFHPIDLDNLEVEWKNQHNLFHGYAVAKSDAERDFSLVKADGDVTVAEAKEELELVTAELDASIRERPSEFGLEKLTEPLIKATILRQEEYQDAQKKLTKAKHDGAVALAEARHKADVLDAAVKALDQRKKALEKEVDLWLGSYFSTPRASTEHAREAMEEAGKRAFYRKGTKKT